MKLYRLYAIALALGVFLVLVTVTHRSAKAQNTQQPFVQQIVNGGTNSFQQAVVGSDALQNPEVDPAQNFGDDGTGASASDNGGAIMNRSIAPGVGQGSPGDSGKKAKSNPQQVLSFDGLNHRNQRLANRGNQFSLEPPDQGSAPGTAS